MLPPALRGTAAPPPARGRIAGPSAGGPVRLPDSRAAEDIQKNRQRGQTDRSLQSDPAAAFQRHRLDPGVRQCLPFCAGSQHMIIRECRLDPLLRQERCKTRE